MRAPEKYFRNNIANGLNLLEAMRAAGVGKIIFSSTAATYGNPEEIPMTESHPTVPINPYGESKRCFEKILHRYHDTYGFNYVSLRYFNAAGCTEGQGEDHRPETHIIPLVLKVALGREKAARIYGTDYDTDDGTCVRDYIHIEDLAAAHIRAMTCTGGHIYNLGNGEGFSVREVIETARRVTGKEVKADEAPRRPGDPPVLVASSEKIRRELGWEPRHPSLEEMIESAWKWMRAHPDGYRE
jgi:UDP-glucose 4-epimerase